MFSPGSRAATHSCRTAVMILESFISATVTGKNRSFKKPGSPWNRMQTAAWRLHISHTERPGAPFHRGRSFQCGQWLRPGEAKLSKLLQTQDHGPQRGLIDLLTQAFSRRIYVSSPHLLKTCKSPTVEQSQWTLMYLSQIV